jgi:hypothetical protein
MAKGHIGFEMSLLVGHMDWRVEGVVFQPEVEERLGTVVWEVDCIAVPQVREHICLTVEGQLGEHYMAMLLWESLEVGPVGRIVGPVTMLMANRYLPQKMVLPGIVEEVPQLEER